MKKVLSIILALVFMLLLFGCDGIDTESKIFSQEVTIVKMPSPPKCKTSDKSSIVNEVITVLSEIEKEPSTCGNSNGWLYMIKINVDGDELSYCIASDTFTDSDGKQYIITNFDYISERLLSIYEKIDIPEVDYV